MTALTPKSRVLSEYYQCVCTLSEYLDALLPSNEHGWLQHDDSDSFQRLLTTTLVGTDTSLEDIPPLPFFQPAMSQSEARLSLCPEPRDLTCLL